MASAVTSSLHVLPLHVRCQALGASEIKGVSLQTRVPAPRSTVRRNACIRDGPLPGKFEDDPILKFAFKEPVAFLGGLFAGLLRLDLKEDPLREWVEKTVEAAGIKEDEETTVTVVGPEEITIE